MLSSCTGGLSLMTCTAPALTARKKLPRVASRYPEQISLYSFSIFYKVYKSKVKLFKASRSGPDYTESYQGT